MTDIIVQRSSTTFEVKRTPVNVEVKGRGLTGIQGPQGNSAPNTIWQFSADRTNWSTTVPENVLYMRESSDGGTTWTDAILMPTAAQLALKAPLDSPDFVGTPTAPTQTAGDNSTKLANTAFVKVAADAKVSQTIINGVIDKAPSEDVVFDALALKASLVYTDYVCQEGDPV